MNNKLLRVIIPIFLFPMLLLSQQTVKESSTGKLFQSVVTFKNAGKDYTLQLTGTTVRKKLFFKVYGIAHYMQDPTNTINTDEAFKQVLTDGKAKQIIMDFARDVDCEKIKNAYLDGFKEHATSDELKKIQPVLNQFLSYFTKEMKENNQIILRWLPGGSIVTIIDGEEKPTLTNELFARTLWSIWFGESSIVDRDELVIKMIGK